VWVAESEAHERLGVLEAPEGGGEAVIDGSRKDAETQSEEKSDGARSPKFEIQNPRSPLRGFVYEVLRVVGVDREGVACTLVEERSATFVDCWQKQWHRWIDATGELLWMSERDGWNHIFLGSRARESAGRLSAGETISPRSHEHEAGRERARKGEQGL